MEHPDTDIEVDNDSLVDPVKETKGEQKAGRALVPQVKPESKSRKSHVSPLEVFDRRFSIGARSKSMSDNNEPQKRRGLGSDSGSNCWTPKRLQHQPRNVKLEDDDEELVFDYSNLSFNTSTKTAVPENTKIPHCQIPEKTLGTTIDITRENVRTTSDLSSSFSNQQKRPFSCESRHHGETRNLGVKSSICDEVNNDNQALSSDQILDKISNVTTSLNTRDVEKTNTQSHMGVFSSTQPSTPSMPSSFNENPTTTSNINPLSKSSTPSHHPPSIEVPSSSEYRIQSSEHTTSLCYKQAHVKHNADTNKDPSSSVPSSFNMPSSNTSTQSLNTPLRVGFYEIEKTIGRGNFAVVKLARHRITKTEVCFNILIKFSKTFYKND